MLMTAVHMDSTSTATKPPWLPVLADHHHHNQLLHDFTPAPTPSPSTPPRAPSSHHHSLPRAAPPAVRRVAKRRPRPSRRLPTTTYISADPASFRRMVHQVTGADDLPQPTTAPELPLIRPAPIRASAAAGGGDSTGPRGALVNVNMLLPTLDTSAFLVHALPRAGTDAPSCEGSARSAVEVEAGGAACCNNSGGGFPTMESWDHALF